MRRVDLEHAHKCIVISSFKKTKKKERKEKQAHSHMDSAGSLASSAKPGLRSMFHTLQITLALPSQLCACASFMLPTDNLPLIIIQLIFSTMRGRNQNKPNSCVTWCAAFRSSAKHLGSLKRCIILDEKRLYHCPFNLPGSFSSE